MTTLADSTVMDLISEGPRLGQGPTRTEPGARDVTPQLLAV